jgi:hypothetical protein
MKYLKPARPWFVAFLFGAAAVSACGDGSVAPPEPACTGQVVITPDSLHLVLTLTTTVTATSDVQCGDVRPALTWLVRDPAVATAVELPPGQARVTAIGPGRTYLVARAGDAGGKADSVLVVVLAPPRLTVIAGGGQTDTVDAVLRDSLVVELRDAVTGQPVAGAPVTFLRTPPPGTGFSVNYGRVAPAGPGGRELLFLTDTTDALGRAAVAVKLVGPDPGTGYLQVRVPYAQRPDSVAFTVLPGRPHSIRVVPRDSGTIVGGTLQLRAHALDRRGNTLGSVAPTYSELPPTETVNGRADGLLTGLRFGQARLVASAAEGVDTAWVRVLPPDMVAGRDAVGALVITRLDGSDFARVGDVVAQPGQGRVDWSPDGSTIAFVGRYPGSNTPHIFLAGLDGTSRPLVPAFQNSAGETMPRYSPDGRFVYFSASTVAGGSEIWRADPATGQAERVGPEATTRQDVHPSISPDSRFVVFIRDAASSREIVIMDLQTRAVTSTGRTGTYVSWSPTQPLIAFSPGSMFAAPLTLMRPDGTVVAIHPDYAFGAPYAWSRDGRYLLNSNVVMDAASGGVIAPLRRVFDMDWRP